MQGPVRTITRERAPWSIKAVNQHRCVHVPVMKGQGGSCEVKVKSCCHKPVSGDGTKKTTSHDGSEMSRCHRWCRCIRVINTDAVTSRR